MESIKRVQLLEIADLITKGTTPTTLGYEFQEDGINFLKIECFDEFGNYIPDKVAHISEECNEKLKRSQLEAGDILFSIAGAIGRVGIVTEEMLPANTNQALAIIRINSEEVYLPYIKLILTSPIVKKQFEKKKQGVAQLNVSLKDVNELVIPLPDKDKQVEYANLFIKIGNVLDERKKELSLLDELIKARFVELFGDPIINPKGWKRCKFGDVVFYQEGPGVRNWQFRDSGVKLINIRNVINDSLDLSNTNNYLEIDEVETKYKHFLLNEGDYVMASSGVTWGKIAEVYKEHLPLCLNTSMIRIRPIDSNVICKKYLFHFIKSDGFRKQIERLITGSAQPNFGPSHLAKIDILVPDIELQQKYSLFTEQVDKSKIVA